MADHDPFGDHESRTEEPKGEDIKTLKRLLSKNRVYNLVFDVSEWLTPKQAAELNKVKEEMPSTSDVARADDIELQEITKKCIEKHRESHPAA